MSVTTNKTKMKKTKVLNSVRELFSSSLTQDKACGRERSSYE